MPVGLIVKYMKTITQEHFKNLKGAEKIKALNDIYAKRLEVTSKLEVEDLFGYLSNIVRPGNIWNNI